MFKRILLMLSLASALFTGCEETLTIMDVNQYDPESPYFRGNPASGLMLESVNKKKIALVWNDNSNFEQGYLIEKENISLRITELILTTANENQLIDENIDIFHTYKYRIGTKTSIGNFHYNDSLSIKYIPYSESVKIKNNIDYEGILEMSGNSEKIITNPGNVYDITNTPTLVTTFSGRVSRLSYDGNYISWSAEGGVVGYYNISENKNTIIQQSSIYKSSICRMSRDNKYLIELQEPRKIRLWDLTAQPAKMIKEFSTREDYLFLDINISPDNKYIIGRGPWYNFIWDIQTSELTAKLSGGDHSDAKIEFVYDRTATKFLYYDHQTSKVVFWDLENRVTIAEIPVYGYLDAIKLISNDEFLLLCMNNQSTTKTIYLYKLNNLQPSEPYQVYQYNGWDAPDIKNNGDLFRGSTIIPFSESWRIIKE